MANPSSLLGERFALKKSEFRDMSLIDGRQNNDGRQIGILTGCEIRWPSQDVPGEVSLSFNSSTTDVHHGRLWYEHEKNGGNKPTVATVSQGLGRYGVGGTYTWSPSTEHLGLWLVVEGRGIRYSEERRNRLAQLLVVACGEAVLAQVGGDPFTTEYSYAISAHETDARTPTPRHPFIQHAVRAQSAIAAI